MIRPITLEDANPICNIYNYYIENTDITFEEISIKVYEMTDRIKKITKNYPWFVFEENGQVLGYAYASRWKERVAYNYSVESSVYVHKDFGGRGIGYQLYSALIEELKKTDCHSVVGGVALPNKGSQKLHEKMGFIKVAQFPEIGFKFGRWIDVGYWQLNL